MKRISGIIMIATGLVFAVLLVIEGIKVQGDDLTQAFSFMKSNCSDISSIKSVGGRTLEEAYYMSYGSYLSCETEARRVMYTMQKSAAMMQMYTGLVLCVMLVSAGSWMVVTSRVEKEV